MVNRFFAKTPNAVHTAAKTEGAGLLFAPEEKMMTNNIYRRVIFGDAGSSTKSEQWISLKTAYIAHNIMRAVMVVA